MICESCNGTGEYRTIKFAADPYTKHKSPLVLCPQCNGTGTLYCCEGDCAQPEQDEGEQ